MFTRVEPPSYESILEEWRNGPITVAIVAMAFGQFRLQCWYGTWGAVMDPEILSPEC